jgi:hypothetical protein
MYPGALWGRGSDLRLTLYRFGARDAVGCRGAHLFRVLAEAEVPRYFEAQRGFQA